MRIATRATVLFAAVGLLLAGALPASAHTYLEESQPMWDTVVDEEVTQIALRFNEPVLETIAEIEVTAPDGSTFGTGVVTIDGPHVTRAVTPFTITGEYRVDYMIVAGDGHPLEETFTFTYEGPVAEAAAEPPGAATGTEPAEGMEPAPEPMPSESMAMDPSSSPSPMVMTPMDEQSDAGTGAAAPMSPSPAAEEAPAQVETAAAQTELPMGRVWLLVAAAAAALALGLLAVATLRRFEPPVEAA